MPIAGLGPVKSESFLGLERTCAAGAAHNGARRHDSEFQVWTRIGPGSAGFCKKEQPQ